MNREQYLKEFDNSLNTMQKISVAKNSDYADGDDPFRNFRMVESMGMCSVEQGILVRMSDKISRISNLIGREAKVKDETIEDTLIDLANYSLILKIFLQGKRK